MRIRHVSLEYLQQAHLDLSARKNYFRGLRTAKAQSSLCIHAVLSVALLFLFIRERSGSVVECLTRDRGAAGSSLTGVTVLWFLSKTHLS